MPQDLSPEAYSQLKQILEILPNRVANRPSELRWTGVRWIQEPCNFQATSCYRRPGGFLTTHSFMDSWSRGTSDD
jgi:hypothetical protein